MSLKMTSNGAGAGYNLAGFGWELSSGCRQRTAGGWGVGLGGVVVVGRETLQATSLRVSYEVCIAIRDVGAGAGDRGDGVGTDRDAVGDSRAGGGSSSAGGPRSGRGGEVCLRPGAADYDRAAVLQPADP